MSDIETIDREGISGRSITAGVPASVQAEADRLPIGDLAREFGLSPRALRFYQSKGLLSPQRNGHGRRFTPQDRERLKVILQGKRLGFTLAEVRQMMDMWRPGAPTLPIGRRKCVEQIKLLERQRRDIGQALEELRSIYTHMLPADEPAE